MKKILKFLIATLIFILFSSITNQLSAAVTIMVTQTDVTCGANGSIVIDVTGASGPITYAIRKDPDVLFGPQQAENYFYNLVPGTYVVAVYEGVGFTESAPITLSNKAYVPMVVSGTPLSNNIGATCCDPDGNITLTMTQGKGSPPFRYHLKGGPTPKPDIIGQGGNYYIANFTQLETGTYSIDITDACNNTINSGNISVTSKYNFSNVIFGSLDGLGGTNLKGNGCSMAISFSTDNMLLKDNNGIVIFQRNINHAPRTLPLEARVEYPAGSGNYTGWQSLFGDFTLPAYSPDKNTYKVELRNPCNASNVVVSPEYSIGYPYTSKGGFCLPSITHSVMGYYCGPVTILFTKVTGTGDASKSDTWDGIGSSYTPNLTGLNGTYTVDITIAGKTYRTTNISTATANSVNVSPDLYNYICTKGCDFFTGTLRSYLSNWPVDNTIPITYTMISGPVSRDPVTSTVALTPIWDNLPAGTYNIQVDYGDCRTETVSRTISPPYGGFKADGLSFVPGSTCGKYKITGKGWYLAPDSSISTTSATYYAALFDATGKAISGATTTAPSNTPFSIPYEVSPGTYTVKLVNAGNSNLVCWYQERTITIPPYEPLSIDVPNSGGLICSGSEFGDLHIATKGGSSQSTSFRIKPKGSPDSNYTSWQPSPDFTSVHAGEYTAQASDACGFTTTQDLTLGAVASASYFLVSGKAFAGGQIAPRCEGLDATLEIKITGPATNILWNLPDGTTSNSRILNFTNFSSVNTGLYSVSYSSSGCQWSDNITLSLETTTPQFVFISDTTTCTSIDLTALRLVSGSITGLTFTYWNSDYTQNVTSSAKNITTSGIYHIVGENLGGCSYASTVNVTVRRLNDNAVSDVLFVKQHATGDGTGRDWDNALDGDFLAQYLRSTKPVNGTKIYVAAGTYYPVVIGCESASANRGYAFELSKNIRMRGGFSPAATGTDTISTWNFQSYITRLSGDIGTIGTATDNSYNVVRITAASAILDGFYVSDGYADGAASPNNIGAGVYGSKTMQLNNLVVENNTVKGTTGGGIHAASTLALSNSTIRNNSANTLGGGIYAASTLTLSNSTVNNNTASNNGGGAYLLVASTLTNCTFYNNKSTTNGGAVYSAKASSIINFCTFYGNTAGGSGSVSIFSPASSTFSNNIVQDNLGRSAMSGLKGSYNIVGFVTDVTNLGGTSNKVNTDITQLFSNIVSGEAVLANNGGVTQTLMLKHGGPAHNFIPTTVGVSITNDQRNFFRPVGCGYDAGAVEITEENKPDIRFTIPSVCYGTDIALKSLIISATNVRDTLFYSDNLYSKPILSNTIKVEQSPIYVRFNTTANCIKDTMMMLNINPTPVAPIITNSAFCESGTIANLISRITNLVENGTGTCYASENGNTPLDPLNSLTDGTTYYISQTSDKGCISPRTAVKVTIQQTPVLTLTADDYFLCSASNFKLHASITNVTPSIPWYQWQIADPATGIYAAGNTSDFFPGVTIESANKIEDAIYTPSESSYDSEGKINLRLRVNTGACGYKTSDIILHKNASDPSATISIESQPVDPQTVCQDTVYVVKITDTGQGGLSNIKVTLHDWKSTDLTITGAEYQYPIGSSWNTLTIDNSQDSYKYECQLPSGVELNGDVLLVRFHVKPECGFYAGSNMQFIVNGYDNCHINEIIPASVVSDQFHLNFGAGAATEYALESHLSNPLVTNAMSDPKKVTWTVDYYELISGIPNFITDSIYFKIPSGMSLDVSSFSSPNYTSEVIPKVRTIFSDGGIEYAMPLSSDINSGRVSFSFDFIVSTSAKCGVEQLYMEIIRQGEFACGANPPCTFFETLAQSYPQLTIEWYQLQMSKTPTSSGRMQNGSWTGTFDIQTLTDVLAGAKIPFDFYIDTNGNAQKDDSETKQGNTFEYEVTNAVPAGNIFSTTITTPVPVTLDGNSKPFELLAYVPKEALVCESLTIPIVPLIGEQTVCEGDTVIFRTTPGMSLTTINVASLDAVSGATPKRISAENNNDDWTKDVDKSQAKVVIRSGRGFDIKAQYRVGSDNQLLNSTFMKITAIAKPVLTLKNGASAAICKGSTGIDLSQSAIDTNNSNPETWYYYQKQSDGSYTLLSALPTGTSFFVSPLVNTVYGISSSSGTLGCQSNLIDFEVTVNELPIGNISGDNDLCNGSTGFYFIENTLNTAGWTYIWTVSGTNSISGNNTASTANVNWRESGTLNAIFTDANGCSTTSTLPVNILPLPVVSNLVVAAEPCDPSREATVTFSVPGIDSNWQYNLDGNGFTDLPADAIVQPGKVSLSLTESEAGRYVHFISVKNDNGCASANANFNTAFYPKRSTWIANGTQNNWDDADNWDNGIPGPCTYVVIPQNQSFYPWLTPEMNAVCDTIEFELGGEVARPDLLTYNAAKVHLTVNTMQWYSLSAPLRDMYSGDYMFRQANPITEMRLYNTTSPQTGATYSDWTQSFNNSNIRLNAGVGYSTRVGKIYYGTINNDGAVSSTKTTITNGSWVFPQTKTVFNFYDDVTKKLLSRTEQVPAGGRDNGSRFAYEATMSGDVFVEVPTNRTSEGQNVVVGNPLMSHLDFEKFYNENKDAIAPTFKILANGTDLPTYSGVLDGDGNIIGYTSTGSPQLEARSIAPMQAFIVTTKEGYSSGSPATLKITKDMSVTAPGFGLRSTGNTAGVLRITVSNGSNSSQAAVVVSPKAKNSFDLAEDSRKMLIQGVTSTPSVFTITDGIYVDVNRIKEFPASLPIGISTTTKGTTQIQIEGFSAFATNGEFSFMDSKAGIFPIRNDEFKYSFNNTEGDQIGRFYLRYSPKVPTSVDVNSSQSIQIFVQNHNVHVISPDGSDVENVVIYNLSGQALFQQHYTGKSHITIPVTAELNPTVIVKANTSKTLKTSKLNLW